jgi:hypothetical protein
MKWKAYDSDPLPITMDFDKFVQGIRDVVYIIDKVNKPYELKRLMDFVGSDNPETRHRTPNGEYIDYLPTNKLKITVDKDLILSKGVVKPENANLIVDEMQWTINKEYIQKNEMMVLEIIANSNWERPIYFVSTGGDSDVGLSNYLQHEGFAYRLVPIKTEATDYLSVGRMNVGKVYTNYMENFKWGGLESSDVMVDHNVQRTALVLRLRSNFNRLAEELIAQNKIDSAVSVVDRISELLPFNKFPYDIFTIGHIETYYNANETVKANDLLTGYANYCIENLEYFYSLKPYQQRMVEYDISLNTQVLQELVGIASRYGQEDVKSQFESTLNSFMSLYFQATR